MDTIIPIRPSVEKEIEGSRVTLRFWRKGGEVLIVSAISVEGTPPSTAVIEETRKIVEMELFALNLEFNDDLRKWSVTTELHPEPFNSGFLIQASTEDWF